MKYFFVIGSQASKSLSPLIFNHWFKKYNIQAKYSFLEVTKKNFNSEIVKKLSDKNTRGFNVTIPFKKDIIKYLDKKNTHAQKIGAVNCVTLGNKIKGINTDWVGYLNSIKKEKINKKKNILMLGFGGASQAIYYGLVFKGYKNISVFNRSKKAIYINGTRKYTKDYSLINPYLKKSDLIINTTPTNPLNKKQTSLIKKTTIISDIVYQPKETHFLKEFKSNKKIYGISMLVEQALPSFKQWFGFVPDVDDVLIKKLYHKIK
ncbi:shikimate dehydrogenase [Alphaproteobacteria bacterium]|nr:shikimate dehydrogenase [Alphaproteobacteria bacterium]